MSPPTDDPDEPWFTAMVAVTLPRVTAYVRRRARDPDDVVAEVFATAWRHRHDLPDPALPWLLRVASHQVLHADRSEMRRRRLGERVAGTGPAVEPDHATGTVARLDAVARVDAALERLSPLDREVLRLSAWEELTPTDLAVVLACSTTAAKVRLHRARRRFAAALLLVDHARAGAAAPTRPVREVTS